jgi:hypothetical protein
MSVKTVKRGFVLVHKPLPAYRITASSGVSAVLGTYDEAKRLQKRFGGRIVDVKGQPYRMAQKTLRVVCNPEAVKQLPTVEEK